MSAHNYTHCPRCLYRKTLEDEQMTQKLHDSYGVVAYDEYKELETKTAKALENAVTPTFRENWEVGLFGGTFSVDYSGSCIVCGFSHEFVHEETLSVEESK